MRKILIAGVAALTMAACTTTERNVATGTGVGAAAGALVGAGATGDAEGAVTGAVVGGIAGAVVGASVSNRPGYCYVTNRHGRVIRRGGQPVVVAC